MTSNKVKLCLHACKFQLQQFFHEQFKIQLEHGQRMVPGQCIYIRVNRNTMTCINGPTQSVDSFLSTDL